MNNIQTSLLGLGVRVSKGYTENSVFRQTAEGSVTKGAVVGVYLDGNVPWALVANSEDGQILRCRVDTLALLTPIRVL